MKKWICTVCGYVHEGEEPPDKCPVCQAMKSQFILDEKLPDELEQQVKYAFAGESKAYVRNLAFAKQAGKDELPQVVKLFKAVAEAEKVHADSFLQFLEGEVKDTEQNLQTAFENELKANSEIYPSLVKQALDAGREDLAGAFTRARDVEERHAQLYKDAMTALVSDKEIEYHVCRICGYVFEDNVPDECPVCKAKKDKFKKVT